MELSFEEEEPSSAEVEARFEEICKIFAGPLPLGPAGEGAGGGAGSGEAEGEGGGGDNGDELV